MNTNLIVMAMLCLSMNLYGQLQIGIKGQFSSSLTTGASKDFVKANPTEVYQIDFESTPSRKAIGLSLYADNKYLFFSSDLLYSTSGRNFSLNSTSFKRTQLDPSIDFITKETNAKLVLNSGLRIKDFKIGLGPEFLYELSKEENLTLDESISATDKRLNAGFNFLLGYVIGKHIHLDVKYTYMFNDVTNEFEFDGIPMDMRKNPKYFEIGLAFYL